jgi:ABC-type nitrate/sulfonate/bicarbonate transport system ATPase subunit
MTIATSPEVPPRSTESLGGRVAVRDIAVSFATPAGRRLTALDGINLDVAPGEVVALIGPNGSGKSTLLRVVGGLLKPDRGTVTLDGRSVTKPDPGIGLVFQEPRLLPWRSVAANVAYPLEIAGWPAERRAERVKHLLALVGLAGATALRPRELSGGMRQRAAIARALALEPSVLLLDEPFSALDALTRERFNVELLDLWSWTGTTIIVVTHSIPEAIFLADRVVVLSPRPGRVVAEIQVPVARPRSMDMLDEAAVSTTAREIRSHLGEGTDQ